MKHYVILTFSLLMALLQNTMGQTPTGYEVKRVIIDAGHGGKDPGAIGTGRHHNTESDIALEISKKLREYILKYYNNSVDVIMTRDSDKFIKLHERTKIANEANGDLFISIHCNTNGNKGAYGTETYVIGMHKSKENLAVAKRENQVIFMEDDYSVNYAGFDPSDPSSYVALSMMQSNYLDQSILFADYVQTQFQVRVGRKNRGVKQAGYWVISYTMMPSVLIELGFISNNAEEDFLNSEKGQVYMASAIYRAFKQYKTDMEGYDATQGVPAANTKTEENKETLTPAKENVNLANSAKSKGANTSLVDLEYRVKIASSKKNLALKPYNFNGAQNLSMQKLGAYYTYYSGHFNQYDAANTALTKLKNNGFKDAYLVAFHKGKQISIKEAQSMQNSK